MSTRYRRRRPPPRFLDGAVDFALSCLCLPPLLVTLAWHDFHLAAMRWLVVVMGASLFLSMLVDISAVDPKKAHRIGELDRAMHRLLTPRRMLVIVIAAALVGFAAIFEHITWPWPPLGAALVMVALNLCFPRLPMALDQYAATKWRVRWLVSAVVSTAVLAALFWWYWSAVRWQVGQPPPLPGMWALIASLFFLCSGLLKAFWHPQADANR